MNEADRFWARVDRHGPDECWPWLAGTNAVGYGQLRFEGKPRLAHAVAYELTVGPIPAGLEIDHDCENKPCCNVRHMTLRTKAEHTARHNPRRTHCKRGHELTPENTMTDADGNRRCRTCENERQRERYGATWPQTGRTHCKHGHEFTPENTYIVKRSNGKVERRCRACTLARNKRSR
jgi:hypothetical protein